MRPIHRPCEPLAESLCSTIEAAVSLPASFSPPAPSELSVSREGRWRLLHPCSSMPVIHIRARSPPLRSTLDPCSSSDAPRKCGRVHIRDVVKPAVWHGRSYDYEHGLGWWMHLPVLDCSIDRLIFGGRSVTMVSGGSDGSISDPRPRGTWLRAMSFEQRPTIRGVISIG